MKRKIQTEAPRTWVGSEVLTDPFIFRWRVNVAGREESDRALPGYEWRDSSDGKRRLYPQCAPGSLTMLYTPAPGLFREFASIPPTPEAIADFAGRRGDLVDSWDMSHARVSGGRLVGGTTLARWRAKIGDMRDLIEMWDKIQDKRRHKELSAYFVRTEDSLAYVRVGSHHELARGVQLKKIPPKDIVRAARAALAWELNRRLSDTDTPSLVVPQIAWTPDFRQRIVFRPSNLLAEMWMRFAQAVAGEFGLKKCANPECSEYFQVGLGGKRQDKETCGPKCRQRKSRLGRQRA